MFTAENWPIGANMLGFGNKTSDGTPLLEASSSVWASQLRQVKELGVDMVDPTDAWLPLAKLSDERVEEFRQVLDGEGMSLSSISMTRNSVVDVNNGEQNLADAHRFIELAPSFGVSYREHRLHAGHHRRPSQGHLVLARGRSRRRSGAARPRDRARPPAR